MTGGNGVFVAAGDVSRDGRSEVVVGFNNMPVVSVYDGLTAALISTKNLVQSKEPGWTSTGGTRVAARAGQILVASGAGASPTIQLFAISYSNSEYINGTWQGDTRSRLARAC